ncbi:anaphase-promoting complex subunit 3 [Nematocida displodere]|uniref:Anaphase-promoting complex subunit 3 n=1 Tax=Nematocida displodere TaxID=1805483 RepID=A0A177EII7_9MICR|nr:anaphase-promoting complex subunit 3 [Nematocida displodere]
MTETESFIHRCIKYSNFSNAIYSAQAIKLGSVEGSNLLLGYLFMRNREYRRALMYLNRNNSFSSRYYQALCYKQLKEYRSCITTLEKITEGGEFITHGSLSELESHYVLEYDQALVLDLLGEAKLQFEDYPSAWKTYALAAKSSPILSTAHKILLENSLTGPPCQSVEEENIETGLRTKSTEPGTPPHQHLDRVLEEKSKNSPRDGQIQGVVTSLLQESRFMQMICGGDLGFCAKPVFDWWDTMSLTAISNVAVYLFEAGYTEKAAAIFRKIRMVDPFHLEKMHYYSSILWQQRDAIMLGTLARDLFGVDSFSHITWATLGNYYSLKKETDKALSCFKRSNAIKKDPYVQCLLGHEHFMNSNLPEGLNCFQRSIHMKSGDYSGMAGCGLIYEKIGKIERAEYFFMKAVECNPQNVLLGYLAVKFLTTSHLHSKAFLLLQRYLEIDLSLSELAENIAETENWSTALSRHSAQNEQMHGLYGHFLLELSALLARSGQTLAAEKVLREADGEGQSFTTRKVYAQRVVATSKGGEQAL